jgi:hypothetical protein
VGTPKVKAFRLSNRQYTLHFSSLVITENNTDRCTYFNDLKIPNPADNDKACTDLGRVILGPQFRISCGALTFVRFCCVVLWIWSTDMLWRFLQLVWMEFTKASCTEGDKAPTES